MTCKIVLPKKQKNSYICLITHTNTWTPEWLSLLTTGNVEDNSTPATFIWGGNQEALSAWVNLQCNWKHDVLKRMWPWRSYRDGTQSENSSLSDHFFQHKDLSRIPRSHDDSLTPTTGKCTPSQRYEAHNPQRSRLPTCVKVIRPTSLGSHRDFRSSWNICPAPVQCDCTKRIHRMTEPLAVICRKVSCALGSSSANRNTKTHNLLDSQSTSRDIPHGLPKF